MLRGRALFSRFHSICFLVLRPRRATHNNTHARKLNNGIGHQKPTDELPAALALEFAAGDDNEEGDEGGELDDGG